MSNLYGLELDTVILNGIPPIGVIWTSTLDDSGVEIYRYCLTITAFDCPLVSGGM